MTGKIKIDVLCCDDGSFIVTDNLTTVYGVGDAFETAVADWATDFNQQFDFLSEHIHELAPGLAKQLDKQTRFFIKTGYLVEANVDPEDEDEDEVENETLPGVFSE